MSWSAQFGKSWVIVGGLPAATAATSFWLRVPYVPWYWALTTIPGFSLLKSLVSSSMAGLSTPLIPCQNVIVTGPPAPAGRISGGGRSRNAGAICRDTPRPTPHHEGGEHADEKGRPYGGRAAEQNEGQHGDEGADRRGEPRDPPLAQRRHGCGPAPPFPRWLLLEGPPR